MMFAGFRGQRAIDLDLTLECRAKATLKPLTPSNIIMTSSSSSAFSLGKGERQTTNLAANYLDPFDVFG